MGVDGLLKQIIDNRTYRDSIIYEQIDGSQKKLYRVNSAIEIWTRPVDSSGAWRCMPGSLKYITAKVAFLVLVQLTVSTAKRTRMVESLSLWVGFSTACKYSRNWLLVSFGS